MAFLNYLAPGTYSIVDMIRYDKTCGSVAWSLRIFSSSEKLETLAHNEYTVTIGAPVQRILCVANTPPPVEQRSVNDMWLLGSSPTDAWEDYEDHLAKWTGEKWEFWTVGPRQMLYDVSRNVYMQRRVETYEFDLVECWTDYWHWEKYFSNAAIYADGSNLVKQIYTYLKETKSAFANCVDA